MLYCQRVIFVSSFPDPILPTSPVGGDLKSRLCHTTRVSTLCDVVDRLSLLQCVWHATIGNFST